MNIEKDSFRQPVFEGIRDDKQQESALLLNKGNKVSMHIGFRVAFRVAWHDKLTYIVKIRFS